jgi:serine protease Do
VRYVYGVTAALLLGGAATTLTLNPVGAQTAQNDPSVMAAAPRPGAPPSFADLVERLQPAVVNISTRQSIQTRQPQLPPGFAELFRRFGAPVPDGGGGTRTQRGQSLGSGFIISADGYIVTNNHDVAPARPDAVVDQITVTLPDRTEYEAEVVGRDQLADIAVLKINPRRPLPFVRFGDSSRVRVGDWVVAIGNPFGLGGTVTAAIVSAVHRNVPGGGPYDRYIQTDASINMGNSGGPMFDLNGNVVGINSAIYSPTGGNVGLGFAIPAEQVRPVVEALRRGERVRRGYIGVAMQDIEDSIADSLGIAHTTGILIQSVTPGSPADRAGIRQGDVIVSVAGHPVTQDETLGYLVAQQDVGARVPMELLRGGQRRSVTVTIAERPSEEELARLNGIDTGNDDDDADNGGGKAQPAAPSGDQRAVRDSLGVTVEPLTADTARRLGLRDPATRGVVVNDVDQNSDAGQKGLQPGDVILSVNQTATTTPQAVAQAITAAQRAGRTAVLLLVARGRNVPRYVGIDLNRPSAAH